MLYKGFGHTSLGGINNVFSCMQAWRRPSNKKSHETKTGASGGAVTVCQQVQRDNMSLRHGMGMGSTAMVTTQIATPLARARKEVQ